MTVMRIKNNRPKKVCYQNKNCLEATQLEDKTNHLEKNEIEVESLKKDHKELMKSSKLILKIQQRFNSEKHNVFTEETNKIALSSNDNIKNAIIGLIKTYAYGTSKDLLSKKDKIKCNTVPANIRVDENILKTPSRCLGQNEYVHLSHTS